MRRIKKALNELGVSEEIMLQMKRSNKTTINKVIQKNLSDMVLYNFTTQSYCKMS